jgi:hypothetical protein
MATMGDLRSTRPRVILERTEVPFGARELAVAA